jgi:hypothetical protein
LALSPEPAALSLFQGYDDEGFVLVSLKSFLSGKPLYDEVYSSFQPGFYVFNWLIFACSRAPLCHDTIRLLTLSLWIAAVGLNEQERIWRAAQTRPGLMAVRNRGLIRRWVGGRSIAQLPLVRHIDENFVQVADYGGYEMLRIKEQN